MEMFCFDSPSGRDLVIRQLSGLSMVRICVNGWEILRTCLLMTKQTRGDSLAISIWYILLNNTCPRAPSWVDFNFVESALEFNFSFSTVLFSPPTHTHFYVLIPNKYLAIRFHHDINFQKTQPVTRRQQGHRSGEGNPKLCVWFWGRWHSPAFYMGGM